MADLVSFLAGALCGIVILAGLFMPPLAVAALAAARWALALLRELAQQEEEINRP